MANDLVECRGPYYNWKYLSQHREKLEELLSTPRTEKLLNELYWFYGRCISCTLSLFASMEALASGYVQQTTVYRRKGSRWLSDNTGTFPIEVEAPATIVGSDILWIPTMEKLKKVLPQLSGKNFGECHGVQWLVIKGLKKLRDETTHPKSLDQQALFGQHLAQMFNYDFEAAMKAVRLFINFYARNDQQRISDCPCDWDW